MTGERGNKLRRPAARTRPGARLSDSGFPGLAAGVPADEAVAGDEHGDALEEHAVFLGRVVDCEFGDADALPGDRQARAPRLVRCSRLRPEREVAVLEEEDACPRVAGLLVQRGDDLAERKACPVPDDFREPVLTFEGDDVVT